MDELLLVLASLGVVLLAHRAISKRKEGTLAWARFARQNNLMLGPGDQPGEVRLYGHFIGRSIEVLPGPLVRGRRMVILRVGLRSRALAPDIPSNARIEDGDLVLEEPGLRVELLRPALVAAVKLADAIDETEARRDAPIPRIEETPGMLPVRALLPEGASEGVLSLWLVEVGQQLRQGMALCEIRSEGALLTLPAPVGGRVFRRVGQPGQRLHGGEVLVEIEESPAPRR